MRPWSVDGLSPEVIDDIQSVSAVILTDIKATPCFELITNRSTEQLGTVTHLLGADGLVTLTTDGCFFDSITTSTDLTAHPSHSRVGAHVRAGDGAVRCAGDIAISVAGPDSSVDGMLNEVTIETTATR